MTHQKIDVRKATAADIPAIAEITLEAFDKYARDLGQPEKVYALKEGPEIIARDIEQKAVFIATLDGEPVGSIRYEVLPSGVAYISRFGVKLIAQSCGVGRRLIQAVVSDCSENGLEAIALHTSSRMASLIRFYYGQGFYIHSTDFSRGYVRALLAKPLTERAMDFDFDAMV